MLRPTNLRELREELGILQEELHSGRIERGEALPGLFLRRQIADRLNAAGYQITVPDLMTLCRAHFPEGFTETDSALHPVVQEPRS